MAPEESALSALLDALRVGEGTDLVRELAQWALQQLIDAEAVGVTVGAGDDVGLVGPSRVQRNDQRSFVLVLVAPGDSRRREGGYDRASSASGAMRPAVRTPLQRTISPSRSRWSIGAAFS